MIYPTLRECEKCRKKLRMEHFRRWQGDKRLLFSTCNFCKPEAAIDTDHRSLANAVARGRINPQIADAKLAAREAKTAARRSAAQQRRRSTECRREWSKLLLTPLRREQSWAQGQLMLAQAGQRPSTFSGELPLAPVLAAHAAREAFFEAYVSVLKDVHYRAQQRMGPAGRPHKPTADDVRIGTYVFPESIGTLRLLLRECKPAHGMRLFRVPKLLEG